MSLPRSVVCAVVVLIACEPKIQVPGEDGGADGDRGRIEGRDAGPPELGVAEDAGTGDAAPDADGSNADAAAPDGSVNVDPCWPLGDTEGGADYSDPRGTVNVSVSGPLCQRSYQLQTNAPRRNDAGNPRRVEEEVGDPIVRSGHLHFDTVYTLAIREAKEASVTRIRDAAFGNGMEVDCPAPGCFETGKDWRYVWSRDTGYALSLGLAFFDPPRGASSLSFKVSDQRGGGSPELVQDTGTGGSWPVSTDRVVLALGARALLPYLDDTLRQSFGDRFYEALLNTTTRDRRTIFDPEDGLYRGEQSFLDWREQSYPDWASGDLTHIGMSKSLSTNAAHLEALRLLASMATQRGDTTVAAERTSWANELSASMRKGFSIPGSAMLSSFIPTTLDPAPTHRFDLLGLSLAILTGVLSPGEAQAALSAYPTLSFGPPVFWPQQQFTPIYHNRAIWPFVTAHAAKAARRADHPSFVTHAMLSLLSAAGLFLSNLENLEMASGLPFVDDGAFSGPVVNSERQLWSIGAYLGAVNEVLFGLEASEAGIRVDPYLPKALRTALFPGSTTLQLSNFPFRGKRITVKLRLPPSAGELEGRYQVRARRLDGNPLTSNFVDFQALAADSTVELELESAPAGPSTTMNLVTATGDHRNLYGPRAPVIEGLSPEVGGVRISWQRAGEDPADIEFELYRNGVSIAAGLTGGTTQYLDNDAAADGRVPCYAIESRYLVSGNTSQRSKPSCAFFAPELISSYYAVDLSSVGGTLSNDNGRLHYANWGDPGHSLTVPNFQAGRSGAHLIQIVGANGAGPRETGVTAGVKRLSVFALADGRLVAEGLVFLPHTGAWDQWREGSFLRVNLASQATYRIVLDDAPWARNMSALEHFATYTGGLGGQGGAFHRLDVSEIRILALDTP